MQCGICAKSVPLSIVYVLDECSHQFCRRCIESYAMENLLRAVGLRCPKEGCTAMMSIRDCNTLAPKEKMLAAAAAAGGGRGGAGAVSRKMGAKRLMEEFRHLRDLPAADGVAVELGDDENIFEWQVYLSNFDPKDQLAKDLARLAPSRGGDTRVTMKIVFPSEYPLAPPFVRVLRPRFAFMTGHVTSGGSVCFEMLTTQGWSPHYTVEAVLVAIRANLVEGGAKLDPSNTTDYSEREAKEAFDRMLRTHGWR